jgi:hypothetical protein
MFDSYDSCDNNCTWEKRLKMLTLTDVQETTKKWGLDFNTRTFWKYYQMGLLPKGQKIKGRGNVLYFPEETPQRLFAVHWMSNVVCIPLAEIKRITTNRWGQNPTALDVIVLLAQAIADLRLWDKKLSKDDLKRVAGAVNDQFKQLGVSA